MSWIRILHSAVISFIALTTITASALVTSTTDSGAQTPPVDLPLAMICWNEKTQIWGVAYLTVIRKDGTATYAPPGGARAVTVNPQRIVEPPKDRPVAFDCFGKSIDELRAMGRIIESQRKP